MKIHKRGKTLCVLWDNFGKRMLTSVTRVVQIQTRLVERMKRSVQWQDALHVSSRSAANEQLKRTSDYGFACGTDSKKAISGRGACP